MQADKWICGFWRRIAATAVDGLILAGIGYLTGLVLGDFLPMLGLWGKVAGLTVLFGYFGLMNSELFNGQTLGKRLLKIQVVNAHGESITLVRSLSRYAVLSIPAIGINLQLLVPTYLNGFSYPFVITVYGTSLALIYLYLFNRQTRQSLHDLIVGSYVVNANSNTQTPLNIWRPHLYIAGLLFISSVVTLHSPIKLGPEIQTDKMRSTIRALESHPAVQQAGLMLGQNQFLSNEQPAETINYAQVQVTLELDLVSNKRLALEIARTALENYPELRQKNMLLVIQSYGYDITLWSKWQSGVHRFTAEDMARIE